MLNDRTNLDERQKARRNSIGNQMFILMFYALLFNTALSAAGIKWLNNPADVMVIITVFMGVYLVRLIANSAYLPDRSQNKKNVLILILGIAFSILLAFAAVRFFGQTGPIAGEGTNDNSALILFIISAVGLITALVAMIVKKRYDKKDGEE